MAGAAQPGPTCGHSNPVVVDDGTSCRAPSPGPATVSTPSSWYSFSGFGESISSSYDSARARLRNTYHWARGEARSDYEGARCIYQAYLRAEELAPDAILHETGYELRSLLAGLLPGLLQMVVIVGATTALGATIGGIIGFFFGGVGAAPGAVVGGELGMDAGIAILTWLGVAFLAVEIAKGMGEMLSALKDGILLAWNARTLHSPAQEKEVERGAHEIARSVGILMRLILQAILAYILKRAASGATRSGISTARALKTDGAGAVSEATVNELVGKIRASKFGNGLADWVKNNWRSLRDNPKLRRAEEPAAGGTAPASDPAAPKKPADDKPAKKTEDELVAERKATARKFYQDQGMSPAKIDGHMDGIDFTKPVTVETLQPGTQVSQFQLPGNPQGNYYAAPGTDPGTLGIDPAGRVETPYTVTQPVQVLQSTAADIPDWKGSGNIWSGGSTQYFTTSGSSFTPSPGGP